MCRGLGAWAMTGSCEPVIAVKLSVDAIKDLKFVGLFMSQNNNNITHTYEYNMDKYRF